MAIQCPKEIFDQLVLADGWIDAEDEVLDFLYEALSSGCEYPNYYALFIPSFTPEVLTDWDSFENWCLEISPELFQEITRSLNGYGDETKQPSFFFSSEEDLVEKVHELVSRSDTDFSSSLVVMSVEVECGNERLFLIYEDQDKWALGWGSGVKIVKSLNELTPELGFYECR